MTRERKDVKGKKSGQVEEESGRRVEEKCKSGRQEEKVRLFFQSFEPLQDEKKKREEAQQA